jgi:hypothetical protein
MTESRLRFNLVNQELDKGLGLMVERIPSSTYTRHVLEVMFVRECDTCFRFTCAPDSAHFASLGQ